MDTYSWAAAAKLLCLDQKLLCLDQKSLCLGHWQTLYLAWDLGA